MKSKQPHQKESSLIGCIKAAVMLLLISFAGQVTCMAGTTAEIAHLLSFIEHSECTFIRNGKEYTAGKARMHIERKYEYFRDRIHSAEEFINLSATGSSMTGVPYRVVCSGRKMMTADWLKDELDTLRVK